MMSKKQWSAMLCLHLAYLLLGASIFYHIENPLELAKKLEQRRERIEINKLLSENYLPKDPIAQQDIVDKLSVFCGKPMLNLSETEEIVVLWDFYHAFFFSYTVVSTIGYGNLAPTTSLGRILMIFYGIFGIPINGILFANLGDFFGNTFRSLYTRYKIKNPSSGSNIDYQFRRFGLLGQISLYLLPGFFFFIFLPAGLFVLFEGWDYVLAVYYAFVTLTTIGFGDYVAGMNDRYDGYQIAYKIFLIFWITFGLGYLVMVIGFITQGMRSKRMRELEHKVAQNLKVTQSRIWNGVTKDVSYLRKILNEVYMMRFKPVYNDEAPPPRFHRSSSCPTLSGDREGTPGGRRRALSVGMHEMQRTQSDTDLLAIDRDGTFAPSSGFQPAELLARVVDALGTIHGEEENISDGGFHCFSDSEILASEISGSGWSIGGERVFAQPPAKLRARAVSEVRAPVTLPEMNSEWTWSSPAASDKIKQLMNQRRNGKLSVPNVPSFTRQSVSAVSDSSTTPKTLLSKLNPFKKSLQKEDFEKDRIMPSVDGMTPAEYLRKTARGRVSMAPMTPQRYLNSTRGGRPSRISLPSESADVLEQTTVADLIRALEALHSGGPEQPRRKMGTASLTPPRQPPPLFALFPPEENQPPPRTRRFSVHPAGPGRRQSVAALPPALMRRRMSVHPTLSPPVAEGSSSRRGSLLQPPPYTAVEAPRRVRRLSQWSAPSPLPGPRPRRSRLPPSISETSPPARPRHGSLTEIKIDKSYSTDM